MNYKYFTSCLLLTFGITFFTACDMKWTDTSVIDSPPRVNTAVKSFGRVGVKFNKDKNISTIEGGAKLFGKVGEEEGIGLRAWFTSPGQKVEQPQFVTFTLFTAWKDRTYLDDSTFKVWVDDNLIIDSASKLGGTKSDIYYIHAIFHQEIPYKDLITISQAKKIKMQVGPTQFDVSESDIDLFRDLFKPIEK
jgi:hypothetical protein